MSIERISTIQTESVITQSTDAVERLTLIEKLEKKATQYLQCKKDAKTLHDVRYFGGNANGFTEAINIVKQHEAESEVQEDYKTLTQDVFKGAPEWVRSAAVDEDGEAMFYEVAKQNLIPDRDGMWHFYKVNTKRVYDCLTIGYDYDTTNWQHSAIDRE